jgi:hypothetical protein
MVSQVELDSSLARMTAASSSDQSGVLTVQSRFFRCLFRILHLLQDILIEVLRQRGHGGVVEDDGGR